jgi:hypothetical protein
MILKGGRTDEGYFVQMVKIHIPDRAERAKALVEMARRGRVICLPGETFIVPEPAVEFLKNVGIGFEEQGRGGFDYAEKALRDSLAAQVQ